MANAGRIEKKDKNMNYECQGVEEDVCGDTIWAICIECNEGYCKEHINEDEVCINCNREGK